MIETSTSGRKTTARTGEIIGPCLLFQTRQILFMTITATAWVAKFESVRITLAERSVRCWAAAEARSLGHGGIRISAQATGLCTDAVSRGIREIQDADLQSELGKLPPHASRRKGRGRRTLTAKQPELLADLNRLIDPATRGDPESPLRWTSKNANIPDRNTQFEHIAQLAA